MSKENLKSQISNPKKGFTLIELIVAIGILGVLAVGALVVLNPLAQFQKANDARRKSDLAQIQRALEAYYSDYGHYPTSLNYKIVDPKASANPLEWGTSWSPYINVLPQDPSSNKQYAYALEGTTDGQQYWIYASLDIVSASDQCHGASPCNSAAICRKSGSGSNIKCNYGVSSSNVSP